VRMLKQLIALRGQLDDPSLATGPRRTVINVKHKTVSVSGRPEDCETDICQSGPRGQVGGIWKPFSTLPTFQ
jgi:hypothetical protein